MLFSPDRKELGVQEERYQKQIDELTLSLAEKQEEVTKLAQTLETLKGAQETLNNSEELQEKLSLLQQDVRDRNAQLDCKYRTRQMFHLFLITFRSFSWIVWRGDRGRDS